MRKILLVEDEQAIADTVLFALQREGHQCSHSGTIQDGLAQFNDSYDCIILDVGLPDGSGMDLCREIRKSSNVIIIFLTARNEEIDKIVGLEIGADDYIAKPFSPRELVARVNANLRRAGHQNTEKNKSAEVSESNELTNSGPFSVDTNRHMVSVAGIALPLTKNEYGLLVYLLAHPKKVFSRLQLIEAVWEEPGSSLERTVDAHIKFLRKKIKSAAPMSECIHTHRGFGYSFNLDEI